ncbi:MAG: FAD-dependent monooxygenase [Planctomycetota bacterium]|nr:FAD-dependent monooxygenase [Planctomycetota bacterium]
MSVIQTCDAIIIGGGPAGAMAALQLAGLGWGVVLVEQGKRHRDKACGCCLNSQAISILHDAGFEHELHRIACGETRRIRLHAGADANAVFSLGEHRDGKAGLVVPRYRLDQMLLDRVKEQGVEVLQPGRAKVMSIARHEAQVEINTNDQSQLYRTTLLVGADGLRSRVARVAGLQGTRRPSRNIGISFNLTLGSCDLDRHAVEMFISRHGYLGVVSQGEGTWHFGALVRSSGRDSRNGLKSLLVDVSQTYPSLGACRLDQYVPKDLPGIQGAGLMPCRPRSIANERVALVGDAAGYVDPFTGDGIRCALQGGLLLGDSVKGQRPGHWTMKQGTHYRSSWKREIRSGLRVCSILAFTLRYPALWRFMMKRTDRERHPFQGLFERVIAT